MTILAQELNEDQKLMLDAIYASYASRGKWPDWLYVKRSFRQKSQSDPRTVRDSFPVVGTRLNGPSYSAIRYSPHEHGDDAELRLYIAAGLHVSRFADKVASGLVKAIQRLSVAAREAAPDAGALTVSRDQLAYHMKWDTDGMRDVPDLLNAEPISLISSYFKDDSDMWVMTLNDEGLTPYSNIATIEDYVSKTVELISTLPTFQIGSMTAHSIKIGHMANGVSTGAAPSAHPEYVSEDLIEQLERVNSQHWNLAKLVSMLRELNSAYAAGHQYSSLMLCRAVMDHVPPVFGCKAFSEVGSQISMPATDKRHLKLLGDNRQVSDDALHRHISRHKDLVELHDVPQRQGINTLIRLVIDQLS
ncbi:hypothetical protein ACVDFE_02910 [Lentzea chajnantorensis]